MKAQPLVTWTVAIIALLGILAATIGLFYPLAGGETFAFETVHGETVQVWGQGWYQFDTPTVALGFMGADLVTLLLVTPALLIAFAVYRRGSVRAGLVLAGALAYFLYNYISMGFGAAYNNLFLAYIVIFSASLYGLILLLSGFDLGQLPLYFKRNLPRRGIGIFLVVSGAILGAVWLLLTIIPALIARQVPPDAYYYTTFTTGILDVGVVAPALVISGILIHKQSALGYLLAPVMLVFTALLMPNLAVGGVLQLQRGVITAGQAGAFTLPFVILGLFAITFVLLVFRRMSATAGSAPATGAEIQAGLDIRTLNESRS